MRHRMTPDADADVVRVSRQTRRQFGRGQVAIYADIIDRGVAMVAETRRVRVASNEMIFGKARNLFTSNS